MHSFDVIIVGGGMVGLTLACGLQGSGLRIAIVERNTSVDDHSLPAQSAIRVSALNAASERLLRHFDVWDSILSQRATPYQAMSVWDQDSFAEIAFQAEEYGHLHLGHIIENKVIRQALWQRVRQLPTVQLFPADGIQQVVWGQGEAFITLSNGEMLGGRLLVGADGAHSLLRQHGDVPLTFWEYGHHALVATIRTAEPHHQCARQIFHGDGILAFLPLWQPDLCSIVWSLPPQQAEQMRLMESEAFNRHLAVAFDLRLGTCRLESERLTIPLLARYARDFASHRLALVGDAAHTIHPLAGQGVNLGMMDAAELAAELRRLHQEGKDIGQHFYLRRYERRRKYAAATMLGAMQGFRQLFAGRHPAKKMLRGAGMLLVGSLPGIKSRLVRQAMGLDELPAYWVNATAQGDKEVNK